MPITLKTHVFDLPSLNNAGSGTPMFTRVAPPRYAYRISGQPFTALLRHGGRKLLLGDVLALILAFVCAGFVAWSLDFYLFDHPFRPLPSPEAAMQFLLFAGLGGLGLLWLDLHAHYRQRLPYWETIGHILTMTLIGFLASGFIQFAAHSQFSRLWLGLSWICFGLFLWAGRGLVRRGLDWQGKWRIPCLMIGTGESAEAALPALQREPEMGLAITRQIPSDILHRMIHPHAWRRLLMAHGACHILLALEGGELERHRAALAALVRERLPCSIVPPLLGLPSGAVSTHHFLLHDVLLLHNANRLHLPLPCLIKRICDIVGASLLLIISAPLFLVIAAIVRSDGGAAFFRQKRIGRHGKPFFCYKFRSMRLDAEQYLHHYLAHHPEAQREWQAFQKLKNDVRITRFGHALRRSGIDELPQLFNVLRGEMSLVGPRPILPGQESYYGGDFIYYESVRPGITGPWQVSGRNALTFRERVALEACYTRNWSLWMDMVILLKTIPAVLRRGQAF